MTRYREVYPHVCGATLDRNALTSPLSGLSPRVWGNLLASFISSFFLGSIPTCVGQPD